ncbi:MAG: hypothetical protein LBC53_01235 [Spirochaetaceae bacterium]|jgi:hypothetical protein|nr:hypothetical protein [Spirochaetaceae bacterium]
MTIFTKIKTLAFLLCLTLIFYGCSSSDSQGNWQLYVTEAAGRFFDGSAFSEKPASTAILASNPKTSIVFVEKKEKPPSLRITNKDFPGLTLYAQAPDEKGRFMFTEVLLTSAHFGGWNEVRYAVYGTAVYQAGDADGKSASLVFETPLEITGINAGRVKRGQERLSGDRGLQEAKNREERIEALVNWMASSYGVFKKPPADGGEDASGSAEAANGFVNAALFEAYWRPVLMPEICKPSSRPDAYNQTITEAKEAGVKIERKLAEDVSWNVNYTKRLFPEYMHNFRNSGALLRDWEEAANWIYIKYLWEKIPSIFAPPETGAAKNKTE